MTKNDKPFLLANYPSLKLTARFIYSFSYFICLSASTEKKEQQMVAIFLISSLESKLQ